jgi:hypothetical protein
MRRAGCREWRQDRQPWRRTEERSVRRWPCRAWRRNGRR